MSSSVTEPKEVAGTRETWISSASPSMQAIERVLANIGNTWLPVLLVGEAGVGKDSIARRIHVQSSGQEEGFIRVTCAEETPDTFSAVLERLGGANGSHPHWATTLYLDGINDLAPACQSRLLRTLPDSGSNGHGHHLSARLVCATNRNMEEMMGSGQFLEDLYFRICGLCLRIPPLRQRREDIPLLLDLFLGRHAAELGCAKPRVSEASLARLMGYAWPGNVRELEQLARKLVLLDDDFIVASEFPAGAETSADLPAKFPPSLPTSLKDVAKAASRQAEKELILKTLARTRWNRKRAAQELRISYKALLYKLKEIHVEESLR